MRISLIQLEACPTPTTNPYQAVEILFEQVADSEQGIGDVVLLPELWNMPLATCQPENYADLNGEKTKALLSQLAIKYRVNIVGGSIIEQRGNRYYNTAHVYNREGNLITSYDKVHLYHPQDESEAMTAGDELCVFEIEGIKCGLIICYDLDFGEWVRKLALAGIQLLFIPAAWPKAFIHHLEVLLKARALENQIFTICANQFTRDLSDAPGVTGGHSQIVDPLTNVQFMLKDEESFGTFEIRPQMIEEVKASFDFYRDRRPELY